MSTSPKPPRSNGRSIVETYRGLALLLLNTLVAFAVLNLLLWGVFVVRDALNRNASAGPELKYGQAALASVYPGFSPEERRAINKETWSRPWIRDNFLLFRERPFAGQYVNVHPAGFRVGKNQGPWPPVETNFNVFVFGGSTTFGYGLPDNQTVPSALQEALSAKRGKPVHVYNFGAGCYFSTLERLKFEQLLVSGHQPDVAVFIDGINECEWGLDDWPIANEAFRTGFEASSMRSSLENWLEKLPVMRAVRFVARRRAAAEAPPSIYTDPLTDPTSRERLHGSLKRYLSNKRIIESSSHEFGVMPLFVWQPTPGYGYDVKHHLFPDPPRFELQNHFYGLLQQVPTNQLGTNFFWAGDLQRGASSCLYVDSVHYTAAFSRQIADTIADELHRRIE